MLNRDKQIWECALKERASYPELERVIECDVVIIGGGITGITAAAKLVTSDKRICIIEAGRLAGSTTGFSTSNLYIPIQAFYSKISSKFDEEVAFAVMKSRTEALQYIESKIKAHNIDCNFIKRPLFFYTYNSSKEKMLREEVSLLRRGGHEISYVEKLPIPVKFSLAAKLENQARFNPVAYIEAMGHNLLAGGCAIFEHSPVIDIDERQDYCIITTPKGKVTAKQVIIATHLPKGINLIQTLNFPYRSYAIAVTLKGKRYPNGSFWDMDDPYYVTSTHNLASKKIDLLIVAGSRHKTGQPSLKSHTEHYNAIRNYINERYDVDEIHSEWSAQHYKPADELPYIGLANRRTKRIFMATGYATDGLVYGTVAGMLLSDMVAGKKNPWAEIYNTLRLNPWASFKMFLKENMNVAWQYITDYLSTVVPEDNLGLQKNEAKVMKVNGQRVAAYCDEKGKLHCVSAICTHMKCIVHWNEAERSWDCPCHGSRFTINGEIIEGPALQPLAMIKGLSQNLKKSSSRLK
jgi:glycine/D-amino acid oxidase-like deaminating enzyme/nitrite reductase/ring-hydroxylating ferredoxin subunit